MTFHLFQKLAFLGFGLALFLDFASAQSDLPAGVVDLGTASSTDIGADHPGNTLYRTCHPCHSSEYAAVDFSDPVVRDRLRRTGAQTLTEKFIADAVHAPFVVIYDWSQDSVLAAFEFLLSAEDAYWAKLEQTEAVEEIDEAELAGQRAAAARRVPVDLREIDHLPNPEFVDGPYFNNVHYKTTGGLPQAVGFYRSQLTAKGWQEVDEDQNKTPFSERFNFITAGYYIMFQISTDPFDPDAVTVLISNTGNVDVRSLPMPDDAQPGREYEFRGLQYSTKRSLEEMVDFYRNELGNLGWAEIDERNDTGLSNEHFLLFEKDFVHINVSLSRSKQEKITTVSLGAYQGP